MDVSRTTKFPTVDPARVGRGCGTSAGDRIGRVLKVRRQSSISANEEPFVTAPQLQHRLLSRRIWLRWLWLPMAGAALLAVGLLGFWLGQRYVANRVAALPILTGAPNYTMVNQLGQTVSSNSLLGKVQLVTFLFPYCTTMCPLIAAHLTNFETETLRPTGLADKVVIVSFDIDPQNTGPQQMRTFLSQYGWNPRNLHWQYLVGAPPEVRRVVSRGFGVWYKRVSLASEATNDASGPGIVQPDVANALAARSHADYDIVHDDVLEVVDRRGRIRKIYENADTVGAQQLLAVVRSLVNKPG
ncbi:MAG: SCO family protein [Stellaceae bacterium]